MIISQEIANNVDLTKIKMPDLHWRVNTDTATKCDPIKIGDIIYNYLLYKLKIKDPTNPIYKNKNGIEFDLRGFHISVKFVHPLPDMFS